MHYSMLIEWSDKDPSYLVTLPEWADHMHTPTTHGATYEEAVKNGQEVLDDLVYVWQERGYTLAIPRDHTSV